MIFPSPIPFPIDLLFHTITKLVKKNSYMKLHQRFARDKRKIHLRTLWYFLIDSKSFNDPRASLSTLLYANVGKFSRQFINLIAEKKLTEIFTFNNVSILQIFTIMKSWRMFSFRWGQVGHESLFTIAFILNKICTFFFLIFLFFLFFVNKILNFSYFYFNFSRKAQENFS